MAGNPGSQPGPGIHTHLGTTGILLTVSVAVKVQLSCIG
jgi:hypothetical protein